MADERIPVQCDQCGLTDTDPKVNFGLGRTVHNDCLSVVEREQIFASSDTAAQIVEACEGGLKGDELLAYIESLPPEG